MVFVGGCAMVLAIRLSAQDAGTPRVVEGHVRRPARGGAAPQPVPRQWVILHRVGSDHAGPVDSTRTDDGGGYRFRYRATGRADAVYFVSSSYAGVAYISAPMRADSVRGSDADILVFDTTSTLVRLRVAGRHIVVSSPDPDGSRRIDEVFELSNDSARTLVSRDAGTPLWTVQIPQYAEAPSVNEGDIPPAAVTFRDGVVELFAPVSPGIRQLAITFRLPPRGFPLAMPAETPVTVLEVLTEEPQASASMAQLHQTASVSTAGRSFARFLAEDVPAASVLRIDVPSVLAGASDMFIRLTAITMGVVMLVALVIAIRRGAPQRTEAARTPQSVAANYIRVLAELDAAFEREARPSTARRMEHDQARQALKRRIGDALAAARPAS